MVYDKHWQALTNNIEWDHRDGDRWVTSRLDELLRQLSNPESEREQSLAESRELLRHGIALGLMMALMVKQCTFSDMVPWSDESMQFKWEFIECRANLLVSNSVVLEFRCFIAASLWICLWQERLMFTYFYPGACLRRSWWMLLPPGKNMVYPSESPIQVKSQEIATYNLNLKLKDECYEDVWRKYCVALILFPLHFGLGANQTFHVSSMFPCSRQIMPGCYCNRCHAIFQPWCPRARNLLAMMTAQVAKEGVGMPWSML